MRVYLRARYILSSRENPNGTKYAYAAGVGSHVGLEYKNKIEWNLSTALGVIANPVFCGRQHRVLWSGMRRCVCVCNEELLMWDASWLSTISCVRSYLPFIPAAWFRPKITHFQIHVNTAVLPHRSDHNLIDRTFPTISYKISAIPRFVWYILVSIVPYLWALYARARCVCSYAKRIWHVRLTSIDRPGR